MCVWSAVWAQMERHLQTLARHAQWERNWVRLVWLFGRRLARSSRVGLFLAWGRWQRRRAAALALAGPEIEPGGEEDDGEDA